MGPNNPVVGEEQLGRECRQVLDALGCPHDEATVSALGIYLRETERWGGRIDLTAARNRDEFVDLALADAAVIARIELSRGRDGDEVADIGSGGGAPGIPLLLLLAGMRREVAGRLVEPRTKRVAFLRSVVGQLPLPLVDVVRSRSDVLASSCCDVALARATLPPPAWLEEGARLSRRIVWVLLAKDEPPELDGWKVDSDERYRWPLTGCDRRAVRYVSYLEAP